MKKFYLLLFTLGVFYTQAQTLPNCNLFYAQVGTSVIASSPGIPNTSTVTSITGVGTGIAIGPAFGFPAPNPTFWTTIGGNFHYWNGFNFVNSGHTAGAVNPGGSKNYLFNLNGGSGQVYRYDGTGNATLLVTLPALAGAGPFDLLGDDQDHFYFMRTQPAMGLLVYDKTGVLTCSYSATGLVANGSGGGFAINGNTVSISNSNGFHVGIISGTNINFTTTPSTLGTPGDFASCPLSTVFNTTINAVPSSSLNCTNTVVTLGAIVPASVTPVSYTWSGPGIISPINNQTVNVNVAGTYTCSLTSSGCPTKTSTMTINVVNSGGSISPTITPSGVLSCTNPTVQLYVSPSAAPHTFTWTGPGIVGSNNSATISVNASGTYTVFVLNTVSSCSGTATFFMNSSIGPLAINVNPPSAVKCSAGSPVTLSASGATNYTWTPSATLSSSVGAFVTASPSVTTSYTVFGTTGVCSGSAVVTVSVIPNPTVVITSGSPTICAGNSATISASGASSYTWNPGSLTGASVSVSPSATTVYTVIGANGSCTSSTTVAVAVNPSPSINASASPTNICSSSASTVSLTASGASTYTWQPGGMTGSTATVSPGSTTAYTVSGTNGFGCIGNAVVSVSVTQTPTVNIIPSTLTICNGDATAYFAAGASSYTWLPGPFFGPSIVVSPSTTTTYTLIGTNGICTGTTAITLTVNPTPTITSLASPTNICSGSSSTLSALGGVSYTWNPGAVIGQTLNVTPGTTTNYTVTGENSFGCTANSVVSVSVTATPSITITSNPPALCFGNTATITASGATNYTWNPGAILGASIVVNPTVTTTYTALGANGNCSSSQIYTLVVNPNPTITATSSSSAICVGGSVTLSGSGATSYTWNPGSLSGASVVVSPTLNTTYTVTGSNGLCTSTRTISIVVNPNPTITASASGTNICSAAMTTVTLTGTGATTYTWLPGGMTGVTTTVTPTSNTTYTVIGINGFGCSSSNTITIFVTPTPTLTATSSSSAICSGSSATLSVSGAGTYTWNPGTITGSFVVVSPTINTTYTVTGANGICTSSRTLALIVNPNPTLTIMATSSLICSGNSSTLSVSGAVSYTWNPGALNGSTVIVTPATTTIYTVTGSNAFGCSRTASITVSVTPTPTINTMASPTAICVGASATLTSSGASSYTWNPGAMTGGTVVVSPTVSTTYTVIGTTGICSNTKTLNLIVNVNPTITATSTPTAICVGSSATLTANGGLTYSWNPGALTGGTVIVSPTSSTTYTVIGSNGLCTGTRTLNLLVNPNPTLNIVATQTNICSASSTTVGLIAFGATSYTWLPSGATGGLTTVSPTVTTTYTLIGANTNGCTSTRTITIVVSPTPTLNILPNPAVICSGNSLTLTVTGANGYTWNPGPLTGSLIVVSPTVSTTYTVRGVIGICSRTQTLALTVNPNPTITASASNPTLCAGDASTLSANGGLTYTWNPGAMNGQTIVITPTATTIYTVTGNNSFGCTSSTTVGVGVTPIPNLTITSNPPALCIGETATITASGATTYSWLPGGMAGNAVAVTPSASVVYTINAANGTCTSNATYSLNVSPTPTISITASDTLICLNTTTLITLNGMGATNYTWMPGALTGSIALVSPTVTTTYTLTGNNGACDVTATLNVIVFDCNNTFFGITKAASTPKFVNGNFEVTYTVTATNASTLVLTNVKLEENLSNTFPLPTTYTVVGTPSLTSLGSSLSVNPFFDGSPNTSLTSITSSTMLPLHRDTIVFKVMVTPNGVFCPFKNTVIGEATAFGTFVVADSSNNGFYWDPDGDNDPTNNDTLTSVCFQNINLQIPTGFSPNGDGINDFFEISGLNGRTVKLTVFNRWGNLVYQNNEYDNTWNGTINVSAVTIGQNKLPQATYFYIIEFNDGERETVTGYVVLQY